MPRGARGSILRWRCCPLLWRPSVCSKNSVAIIIAAMVIAPLLGPSVALALGTTLGDLSCCGARS